MGAVDVLGYLTAGWGVVMALAPVLQIRRMVARQSADDLSVAYFVVLVVGFCLWLGYGITRDDPVLIIPNITALLLAGATIGVAVRYRWIRRHGLPPGPGAPRRAAHPEPPWGPDPG